MSEALRQSKISSRQGSQIRKFFKKGPGAAVFRSDAYRKLLLWKHFCASYVEAVRQPNSFQDVKTYCMFVGHNKSGTSMIGSLLDAHPNAILADEADALEYIQAGFSREQIFHILLRRSRREYQKGRVTARRLQAYSYLVTGQWQGGFQSLQVIGDSTAGSSTLKLGAHPDLLKRAQDALQDVELKIIQIVRNPYDPISAMMVRGHRSFENASELYFSYCEILEKLRKQLDTTQLYTVRYEDFVRGREGSLERICNFLGLATQPDYLGASVSILHETPATHRELVQWDVKNVDRVAEQIRRFDFLQGYSFES